MKQYPETISHREFFRFAEQKDWQTIHEAGLRTLVDDLSSEAEHWRQPEWGQKAVTPMVSAFIPSLPDDLRLNARDKIAAWWRIGSSRSAWAYISRALRINRALFTRSKFSEHFGLVEKYPAPLPEELTSEFTDDDWAKLRLAYGVTQAIYHEDTGLLCAPISELFFAFEAFSKAICSSRCGVFLEKMIKPDSSVQHQEVWKTLKRLSADRRKDSICRECKFREVCPSTSEGTIFSGIYVRLIHIRVLRDYREDVLFDRVTRNYLADSFFSLSINALRLCDRYLNHSLGGFLQTPIPLEEELARCGSIYPDEVVGDL